MKRSWPKAAFFDLDVTLVDSLADIAAALARLLAEEGLEALTLKQVLPLTGDGVGALIARAFAGAETAMPPDAVARFQALYGEAVCVETQIFPGVERCCVICIPAVTA